VCGIAIIALSLAVLPAALAMRLLTFPIGWVGAALWCLSAAVGGVKLIAMAWAMGARLLGGRSAGGAIAAVVD
jgi:hypothetical protein